MNIIVYLVYFFYLYLLLGLVFGLWFVFAGAHRIDEHLKGGSFWLRLLLLPGSMALWPVLLLKIVRK